MSREGAVLSRMMAHIVGLPVLVKSGSLMDIFFVIWLRLQVKTKIGRRRAAMCYVADFSPILPSTCSWRSKDACEGWSHPTVAAGQLQDARCHQLAPLQRLKIRRPPEVKRKPVRRRGHPAGTAFHIGHMYSSAMNLAAIKKQVGIQIALRQEWNSANQSE